MRSTQTWRRWVEECSMNKEHLFEGVKHAEITERLVWLKLGERAGQ